MDSSLSKDEAIELARASFEDPAFFCRTFLADKFFLPMPWIHRGIFAILSQQTDWLLKFGEEKWSKQTGVWDGKQLDKILRHFVWQSEPEDADSPRLPLFTAERSSSGTIHALHLRTSPRMLFIMPRGVSKTTLLNAHNLREIARHETDFLVYISEAATHAEMQLETVKRELEGNILYISVFGQKKPERSSPEKWTQQFIETTDGIAIAARGSGAQIRGMNHLGKRPSDIIFDDVEDKESVKTDAQRDKYREWLKADVEPALPQIGEDHGRLIGLGTVLHPESLLVSLSKSPEWLTVKFGAVDPDGDMLWDHYMTRAEYETKKTSYARIGKLQLFGMEYESNPKIKDPKAKFPLEHARYEILRPEDFPGIALACDPAISDNKDSDYCAFAVAGMSPKGRIHIFDLYMERGMTPRDQVDKYFELHFRWDCNKHGIESIAYQRALIHLVREEMFRRGKNLGPSAYFEVTPIQHGRVGKTERVEGVFATRYTAGYVTFQRRFPELEEQMLDWPNGKKDGPDAVAMAITLLDPFAAFAYDPESEDEQKLEKDHYPPLEVTFAGDWRSAP